MDYDEGILAHLLVQSKYNPPSEIWYQPEPLPWWENIKIDCDIKWIYEDPDPCLMFYYETILLPAYNSTYHGNVLALFGGDFHYQSETNFDYIDKFIELLN